MAGIASDERAERIDRIAGAQLLLDRGGANRRAAGDALRLRDALRERGLESLVGSGSGASKEAIEFFRSFDLAFRIRRLRLLARRTARDWEADPDIPNDALDRAREAIYSILAEYFERDGLTPMDSEFAAIAREAVADPGAVLDYIAEKRNLMELDTRSEAALAKALSDMPRELRRRMMYAYLGFPFYDVATLPILGTQGMNEFEPVKVDRISPEDAQTIREGGASATLRGIEFYDFGAFFSRAYRENDYLWGRLHGCERLIDIVLSTSDRVVPFEQRRGILRRALLAIIEEERGALRCSEDLLDNLKAEIEARVGGEFAEKSA